MSRQIRVLSYWIGAPYRDRAEQMAASAKEFGLKTEVLELESRGSWKANTEAKPSVILEAFGRFKGEDILWIDADAYFVRKPDELFDIPDEYSAALYVEQRALWGCTMLWRDTPWSRKTLNAWNEQQKKTPKFSSDSNLCYVVKHSDRTKLFPLPPSYVWHHAHMRKRFPGARPCVIQDMIVTFKSPDVRRAQIVQRSKEDWK